MADAADEVAVDVVNSSEPTLCAEHDNVTVTLTSAKVGRFRLEATHPAYIGNIASDSAPPDPSHCDFAISPEPVGRNQRVTIYESEEWQLIGYRLPTFWRQGEVPVRVGDRTEAGLHLLQLWRRFEQRAEEVLVIYPTDGYWRARPLPPAHLRWVPYGSSFLVGPVETEARPFVDVRSIGFNPSSLTFALVFARGGSAEIKLIKVDRERIVLDMTLDPIAGLPFGALRSMFVMETNADVARIAWREKDGKGWHEEPIMSFGRASAVELWAGRAVPSRHNLSAPDMRFSGFSAARP